MNCEIIVISLKNDVFEAVSEYARIRNINVKDAIEVLLKQAIRDYTANDPDNH
jgi:hypothetical protein